MKVVQNKLKFQLKLIKQIACFLMSTSCIFLTRNTTNAETKTDNIKNITQNFPIQKLEKLNKATPYTEKEIKDIVDKNWCNIKNSYDLKKTKKILILGPCGGFGLDDPYLYTQKDENENRKMNDSAYLLMYAIPKYLDEDIVVLFVNGADNTIKILDKNKCKDIKTILPDIKLNSNGTYDKYYSGTNQMMAVRYLTEKIAKLRNCVKSWKQCIDEKTDDPIIDEKTGEPLYEIESLDFAPKTIAHMSLQTNANDLHMSKGMQIYFHKNDGEGKLFSEKIAEFASDSFMRFNDEKNKNITFPTDKKIITRLGNFGVPTAINFFDYTDNKGTQYKFFDYDAIERAAMKIAKGICNYFNININFSNINFEPIYNEKNALKRVDINIEIKGYGAEDIKKCSIAIVNANDKEALKNEKASKKDLNIEKSDGWGCVKAKFKFVPPDNMDLKNGKNNKFYIKIYEEDEKNDSTIEIPSNVTNFEICAKNGKILVKPNEVYQNKM